MVDTSRNRRRSLMIPKDFQQRLILIPTLSILLIVNITAMSLFIFFPDSSFAPTTNILLILAGSEILLIVAFVAFVSLLSHRIAGPAFNLSRALGKLGNKDFTTRTVFRTHDFNQGLATSFNEAAGKLSESIEEVKQLVDALGKERDNPEERERLIHQLTEKLSKFTTQ